jgi:hypothetical protein
LQVTTHRSKAKEQEAVVAAAAVEQSMFALIVDEEDDDSAHRRLGTLEPLHKEAWLLRFRTEEATTLTGDAAHCHTEAATAIHGNGCGEREAKHGKKEQVVIKIMCIVGEVS